LSRAISVKGRAENGPLLLGSDMGLANTDIKQRYWNYSSSEDAGDEPFVLLLDGYSAIYGN
jgi:hypothetical protein